MSLPSNETFAAEVKSERLQSIVFITMILSAVILLAILSFGISQARNEAINARPVLACIAMLIGCFITNELLRREKFEPAAWTYALSVTTVIGVLIFQANDVTQQMLPFLFPVIVFLVGLLISPVSTFIMATIAASVVIALPSIEAGSFSLNVYQAFAVFLMYLSAGLAAQVTGELYQITGWALQNYQKQRRTNDELFEKREALQRSLKRSEALSEKLSEINSELETARAAAEEAKHFRGQFLANMSHELRTPLNAIIGFSETMLEFPIMYDDESLPPAYERDLSQIYYSGRQLLHVINDILDLAKVDAGKLEIRLQAVELSPILSAAMSTAKGLLGQKPVKLEHSIPSELPLVMADETRLRQVLLNLYSNATKYTDAGSIHLYVDVTEEEVVFSLKDTGIGIDPMYHDKLFAEFEQVRAGGRDPRSGSGLGLAISKQLITLMEGRIWMESELGVGSTFSFAVKHWPDTEHRPSTEPKRSSEAQPADHAASAIKAGEAS